MFRTSVLLLFVASVVALWLLVRPPSLPGETSGAFKPQPTTPPIATTAPTASPAASQTPAPTAEATPEPTMAPEPEPIRYTMQEGDTVSGVAEAYGLSYLDLLAFNGLTEDDAALLQPGDEIRIPQ